MGHRRSTEAKCDVAEGSAGQVMPLAAAVLAIVVAATFGLALLGGRLVAQASADAAADAAALAGAARGREAAADAAAVNDARLLDYDEADGQVVVDIARAGRRARAAAELRPEREAVP